MNTPMIIDLSPGQSLDDLIESSCPLIVDFHAHWCPPCRKLGPIIENECKTNKINLCKVNVDEHKTLSFQYSVSGIPKVLLFKDKKLVMSFTGYREDKLKTMISVALGTYTGKMEDLIEKSSAVSNMNFYGFILLLIVWGLCLFFRRGK